MNNNTLWTIILAVLLSTALCTTAFGAPDDSVVKVRQLTERLYLLSTDQGSYTTNTIASVGPDGLLLVDTQTEKDAPELKKVTDSFGKGNPDYIINTHRHVEHIGGNALYGEDPVVIAHEKLPGKLTSGTFIFDEYPPATFPDITVADSLSLYYNGEKIRVIAMAGSHDDNEIIVHFTESNVVHLSSLVNGFNFPSVDSDGDVLKFPELVAKAMELLPDDVVIVSGHNDVGTASDLSAYHEMLVATTEAVAAAVAAGLDLEALQEKKTLGAWASYAGSYVSVDGWTEYLYEGLTRAEEPRKKEIYEPIYYALRDGGLAAGLQRYHELKGAPEGEYEITDVESMFIGHKLLNNERIPEAIGFLRLSLEEYPTGKYAFYAHYDLALAYQKQGEKDLAIQHCEKTLALNPDFPRAVTLREELEEM